MIHEMIQMSYLSIIAAITLILFVSFNSTLTTKTRSAFLVGGSISLLMILCNIIMYLYGGTGTNLLLLKLAAAVSYSISGPVILPLITLSSVIRTRIRWLLQGFAILNAILCFCSIATGWVFRYDEMGVLSLGKLSPLPFYLSAMYLGVLLAASLIKFRLGFRNESVFILVLTLGIIAAVVMNTVFDFKFLISGMAVLSCIFYYLFYTTQTLTRDAMTGAFNRHSFYKDIEYLQKRQMIVISMDLNGLKQINDTLGHDAGDLAITAVADSVFENLPAKSRFYRMGGDEFEILCPDLTPEKAEVLIRNIKAAVQAKSYSVAAGYCAHSKGGIFDDAYKTADSLMYADKEQMKQAART